MSYNVCVYPQFELGKPERSTRPAPAILENRSKAERLVNGPFLQTIRACYSANDRSMKILFFHETHIARHVQDRQRPPCRYFRVTTTEGGNCPAAYIRPFRRGLTAKLLEPYQRNSKALANRRPE